MSNIVTKPQGIIARVYLWVLGFSRTKKSLYALCAVAFTESSFFVIPPDVLLIPMCMSAPRRAFFYATLCGTFSVLGGLLGYAIGYGFYSLVGVKIVEHLGYQEQFKHFAESYGHHSILTIFIGGFTPLPYKLVTLGSGFLKTNIFVFLIGSIMSRFARFYIIATVFFFFGHKARHFVEKHLFVAFMVIMFILIGFLFYLYFKDNIHGYFAHFKLLHRTYNLVTP